jgi:hypothetical protein
LNNPEDIRASLGSKTIAVVGASRDPSKEAHTVPAYLKTNQYEIVPVNPYADEILGAKCYKTLLDIPPTLAKSVEVVDIFRPSEDVPPVVEQAIQLKKNHGTLKSVWMQLGIRNEVAAEKARNAGLKVVQNACIRTEHARYNRPAL